MSGSGKTIWGLLADDHPVVREGLAALVITAATLKTHVNNLLGKLSVSDRTQAVTEVLRQGIVHLD